MEPKEEIAKKLLERRILVMTGEITKEKVDEVRSGLIWLNALSNDEIKLIIDTKGGECEPGFWLVDFVQMLSAPVIGIVNGECYSIGIAILQGCRKRLATPHSWFQVHFTGGTFRYAPRDEKREKKFEIRLTQSQKVQEQMLQLLSSRTGKTPKEIIALCEKGEKYDWRFSASEAKELGFVDKVVEKFELFPAPPLTTPPTP